MLGPPICCYIVFVRIIAFGIVSNSRIQAMSATFWVSGQGVVEAMHKGYGGSQ
jgi:hypothetical protein